MAFHNIPPNGFPDLPDMEEVEAVVKDVTTLKTSVAGLASDVSNLSSSKANQITIAPFFNAEASYDPGDIVYYNGLSYRCVNAHEGEWDADDFAATTIAGELDALKNGLTSVDISSTMTFETGITVYKSVIRKVASMVVFSFQLGVPLSASFIIIGTITGNRPQSDIVFSGMAYTGTDGEELPCMLNVDPAGQFILSRTNSKEYVVVSGSYAV